MKFNYEKVYIYTVAGFCGVIGFAASYVILGWLFESVQEWLENKIKGME